MRKSFMKAMSLLLAAIMLIGAVPVGAMDFIDAPIGGGNAGSGWAEVDDGNGFAPPPVYNGSQPDFSGGFPDNALRPEELPPGAEPGWDFDIGDVGMPPPPIGPDSDYGIIDLPPIDDSPVLPDADDLYPPATGPPEEIEALGAPVDVPADGFVLPLSSSTEAAFVAWLQAMADAAPGAGDIDWSLGGALNLSTPGGTAVTALPQAVWMISVDEHSRPLFAGLGSNPSRSATYTATADSNQQILQLLVQYATGGADFFATQMAVFSVTQGDSGFAAWGPAASALSGAAGVNTDGWSLYRWNGSGQSLFTVVNGEDDAAPNARGQYQLPVPTGGDYRYVTFYETRRTVQVIPYRQVSSFTVTEAHGVFWIDKVDQDGRPLNGAEFRVTINFENGPPQVMYVVANDAGSVEVNYRHPDGDIQPATIKIEETRAPMFYAPDPTPQFLTVRPSYNIVTIVTEYYETIVHEAVWMVTVRIEGCVEAECTCTTSGPCNPDVTITIEAEYIIREYDPRSTVSPANVFEEAHSVIGDINRRAQFTNTRERGEIVVYKRCAVTGHHLADAQFRLESISLVTGEPVNRVGTTNANGYYVFSGLLPGTYRVTEIAAPPTHNLDAPPQSTTIQSNERVVLTFNNTRRQGLSILKVGEYGQPLQGAIFEITRGSGGGLGSFTTDANGLIIIPNHYLSTGYYIVREIHPPAGFLIDEANNPQSIFIDNTRPNETYQLTFRNFRAPSIEIIKVDGNTGVRLGEAAFRITNSRTGQTWDVRTDANGRAYLGNLTLDTLYIVEETQAPPGYVRSNYQHEIILRENRVHTITVANYQEPSVRILKRDRATGLLLPGATFTLAPLGSVHTHEITTNANGEAIATGLQPGTWILTEIRAPSGFVLDSTPRSIIINAGEHHTFVIYNDRAPSLELVKISAHTGLRLPGAGFRVTWNNGTYFRDVTTNNYGVAVLTDLMPGWFTIVETRAPNGYILSTEPTLIYLEPGEHRLVTIINEAYPALTINKICSVTANPLAQARFRIESITDTGYSLFGIFTTDENGQIHIPRIPVGRYRVREIDPPPGFRMDRTVFEVGIDAGQHYTMTVTNTPLAPIFIRKVDPQGNPLLGAQFTITTMNGGHVATVTSAHTGYAIVPNVQPGWYIVREVRAPQGYVLSNTPQTVEVFAGRPATVTFVNHPMPILQISKVDANDGTPLAGATFRITEASGRFVGEHTTGANGLIVLDDLPPGNYVVTEIRAPDGFILDMTPQTVSLQPGRIAQLEFRNVGMPGLQLLKLCSETGNPVAGAIFSVTRITGPSLTPLGSFTTGPNGMFFIPDLLPGEYVITETHAPPGFFLDPTPRNIFVEGGRINLVQFYNTPYSNLRILKICSVTRAPLADATFRLFDDRRIEVGTFVTNSLGEIFAERLPAGTYFLQETRPPAGFMHDSTVRQIELIGGRTTTVEWPNVPLGSLRIVKVDAQTRAPLYGVTFELLNNTGASLGRFRTDRNGVIAFHNLTPGRYQVREVQALQGYLLDHRLHTVIVPEGETVELIFENIRLGTLRLIKECEVYGTRLRGATFLIYDSRRNLLSEHVTDDNGVIYLPHRFTTGRYYVQEIRAPEGFVLDNRMRAVDMRVGYTTTFTVQNTPQRGQIQIIKVSDAFNDITRQAQGARLEGAVFQIFNERYERVDEIRTDRNGVATSIDLPFGRYAIREVRAPRNFLLNDEFFYVEIKVHGEQVRVTVENTPIRLDVNVTKRSVVETMGGDVIRYEFSGIANNSNTALDEFYWRDTLPTSAVRVLYLNTGTWSHRGTYEMWARTNQRGWFRVRGNLHTNVEYTIDLTPQALRLAANEFVTETRLNFGTVPAGFHATRDPFITVRVQGNLPMGYTFTNRTDVGGRVGNEWVYDRCSWVTGIFRPHRNLPRTGGPGFAEFQAQLLADLYGNNKPFSK